MTDHLLTVDKLETSFYTKFGEVKAVRGVSLALDKGEILGIVGESGSGKSVTAYSIINLLDYPGRIKGGHVYYDGKEITGLPAKKMRKIRGKEIGVVFQDPMTSLNPVYTIGNQMSEIIRYHLNMSRQEAKARVIELLGQVGIPDAQKRYKSYPHQFSGGMRQRVVIANAISSNPRLLIADEPTTALDVTIQAQILDLLKSLVKEKNMAMILITHDLAVISETCQKVMVLYGGRVMERGTTSEVFVSPSNPYTRGLLGSVPKLNMNGSRLDPIEGTPPDLLKAGNGCPFAPRCKHCMRICQEEMPPEYEISPGHTSACWLLDKEAPDNDYKNADCHE